MIFAILTIDMHGQFDELTHADKLDDHVVAGKRAYERHDCSDCFVGAGLFRLAHTLPHIDY